MDPEASQSRATPPSPAGRESGDATPVQTTSTAASVDSRLTVLGWTSGDRWFALIMGGTILALLLAHWIRATGRGASAIEIEHLETAENRFQLDINDATWVEWMQLEGVGETLSRRIVDDRERNGRFASIDEIQRVRGIGPKTVEELRPWLTCADCASPPAIDDVQNQ